MSNIIQYPGGTTVYIREYVDIGGIHIQQSTDQTTWNDIAFPCNVKNLSASTSSDVLTIIFNDITLTVNNQYFTCTSNYITFGSDTLRNDGSRPVITISNIVGIGYPGLIKNSYNSYSNITIQNIIVDGTTSTLAYSAGWIAQTFFGNNNAINNVIKNCSSIGTISNGGGGIAGQYTAFINGSIRIIGCSSNGNILNDGGGIVGQNCGQSGGYVDIIRCYSSGNINGEAFSSAAGGIAGKRCGFSNGNVNIEYCYTIGSTINGGGIVGFEAGMLSHNTFINIKCCYSTGNIGQYAGGIVAQYASNTIRVSNCYSIGSISDGAGGIYGSNADPAATANHCYTCGVSSGTGGGIFAGSTDDNRLGSSNNYSEGNTPGGGSGGWVTTHASVLQGIPSSTDYGNTWSRPDGNEQPYKLSNSGYSPYSLSLVDSAASTIAAGGSTPAPLVPGYTTFVILQINSQPKSAYPYIDINNSGVITADSTTPAGTYTIYVYSSKNPYSVTEYTLHVTAAPTPVPTIELISCCDRPLYLTGVDNTTRAQIKSGNVLIGATTKAPYPSYSDWVYRKMALASKR
jgi:hypothetical protein